MSYTRIPICYRNFVVTRRPGTILNPVDLTNDGEAIAYQKSCSVKRAQRVVARGLEDIKSDLLPVTAAAPSTSHRDEKAFIIPDYDVTDGDYMDFTFDSKSLDRLTVTTRSSKKKSNGPSQTVIPSQIIKKEVDVAAIAFIASIMLKNKEETVSFDTLPAEIVLKIFGKLKKIPSLVLSLTCKRFNRIYKDITPFTVGLNQSSDGQVLYTSLKTWMGDDFKYIRSFNMFVTQGHWARYREELRITNKLLRNMEDVSKTREANSMLLKENKRVRELRACNIRESEEVVRANRVVHEPRRASKWALRERRSRVEVGI